MMRGRRMRERMKGRRIKRGRWMRVKKTENEEHVE